MESHQDVLNRLIEEAKKASKNAYAPYSKFKVGASVITEEGELFSGCNVENASYGLTVCAERVAIFKAISGGARRIKYVAVFAEGKMPYPCGACRQVIAEFADNDTVIVVSDGKKIEKFVLEELLPKRFEL